MSKYGRRGTIEGESAVGTAFLISGDVDVQLAPIVRDLKPPQVGHFRAALRSKRILIPNIHIYIITAFTGCGTLKETHKAVREKVGMFAFEYSQVSTQ